MDTKKETLLRAGRLPIQIQCKSVLIPYKNGSIEDFDIVKRKVEQSMMVKNYITNMSNGAKEAFRRLSNK